MQMTMKHPIGCPLQYLKKKEEKHESRNVAVLSFLLVPCSLPLLILLEDYNFGCAFLHFSYNLLHEQMGSHSQVLFLLA